MFLYDPFSVLLVRERERELVRESKYVTLSTFTTAKATDNSLGVTKHKLATQEFNRTPSCNHSGFTSSVVMTLHNIEL